MNIYRIRCIICGQHDTRKTMSKDGFSFAHNWTPQNGSNNRCMAHLPYLVMQP